MLDQYTNNSETNVIVSINPVEWRVSEHDQLQVIEDTIATGLYFCMITLSYYLPLIMVDRPMDLTEMQQITSH
jgi:hypothetical protein